ncbi:hypothetical protein O6H91_01G040800 [Diphasiastrum complanatum]|uniref:Uncharacterized protein n=1 Tax=Diphasiastrum complanatum TaxID=34168 RepID=A0ACC2EQ67_DIPCM|nr:hypothetical protein O6H91_01G040800 [Diphasiastrum complanatum]
MDKAKRDESSKIQKLLQEGEQTLRNYIEKEILPDQLQRYAPAETAIHVLQSIVQFHFDKVLEKKQAVDCQKKELWKFFSIFFVFLAILFSGVVNSSRLQCKHSWAPIALCILAHLIFYISIAQTLKCINGFKYQRRCHKLTLGVAAEKLKQLKVLPCLIDPVRQEDLEVCYQEPSEVYCHKFKKRWFLCSLFLLLTSCTMVSSVAAILCT